MVTADIFKVMFSYIATTANLIQNQKHFFVFVPRSLPFLPVHWQNVGVTGCLKTFTRLEFLLAALCRETQLQGDLCDVPGILEVGLVHRQLAFFALLCLEYKVASFTRRDALRSRPDHHIRLGSIMPHSL
jgi:hypothetical protein